MKKTMLRCLSAALLICILCSTLTGVTLAREEQTDALSWEQIENPQGGINVENQDAPQAQAQPAADEPVRVTILLEKESVLKRGYPTKGIAANTQATAYSKQLLASQQELAERISSKVLDGKKLTVNRNLTMVTNLISATVPYGTLEQIAALDGVKEVNIEAQYEVPETQTEADVTTTEGTPLEMTDTYQAWAAGYTGAGSRIAIIDTGTSAEHISFDDGGFRYALEQNAQLAGMETDEYISSLNLLDAQKIAEVLPRLHAKADMPALTAALLYKNSKLPFSFNYVDRSLNTGHTTDTQGVHGSHVAGIAVGNRYVPLQGEYRDAATTVYAVGQAPDAQLITMKVFGSAGGAFATDYMAAIEDAILLGCDAINLSLSSSSAGTATNYISDFQMILDALQESETVLSVSAGNSYSWSNFSTVGGYNYINSTNMDTVGTPGSYEASFTVASLDSNTAVMPAYLYIDTVTIYHRELLCNQEAFVTLDPDAAGSTYEYVILPGTGAASEYAKLNVSGKIVVVSKGGTSFADKQAVAEQNGAIAIIIANNASGTFTADLGDGTASIPCATISKTDRIRMIGKSVKNADGTYSGTMEVHGSPEMKRLNNYGYEMSDFSSWGVPGDLSLKPEIAAPGGSIYSVNGAADATTEYKRMSGTSMAAPQIAGMAAVVAQYVRDNDLCARTGLTQRQLVQSLLMSSATPVMDEANSTLFSMLKQGAGLASSAAAVNANAFLLVDGQTDGKVKAELGDDPDRTGVYTFSFSVNNLKDEPTSYLLGSVVLTQAAFADYTNLDAKKAQDKTRTSYYMDSITTELGAAVNYTIDGVTMQQDGVIAFCDFDEDGDVDEADGQALLDYVMGVRENIGVEHLADIDGDDKIDTYDVQQFLTRLHGHTVNVPAGGSTRVQVTITLTEAQKEALDRIYTGGAYVEAYVQLQANPDAQGVRSSDLSLPMLAYYGSWTDSSVFEQYGWEEYSCQSSALLQEPYTDTDANYFRLYSGKYGYLKIGGNPYLSDETFVADRLSFSTTAATDTWLYDVCVVPIRNLADARVTLTNAKTGESYKTVDIGTVAAVYSMKVYDQWSSNKVRRNLYWTGTAADGRTLLPEGTEVELAVQAAPEYYVGSDGEVDWTALADGSKYALALTIDNTAPKALSISTELLTGTTLTVTAQDNRYVAAVALLDSTGGQVLQQVGPNQTERGVASTVELDLTGFDSEEFIVAVCDYALNETYYRVRIPARNNAENMQGFRGMTAQSNYWVSFDIDENEQEHLLTAARDDYRFGAYGDGLLFAGTTDTMYVFTEKDSFSTPHFVGKSNYTGIKALTFDDSMKTLYACGTSGEMKGLVNIDTYTGEACRISDFLYNGKSVTMYAIAYAHDGLFYALSSKMDLYSFTIGALGVQQLTLLGNIVQPQDTSGSSYNLVWDNDQQELYMNNGLSMNRLDTATGAAMQLRSLSEPLVCFMRTDYENKENEDWSWNESVNYIEQTYLSHETLSLLTGESGTLQFNCSPWNLTDYTVIWSSDHPETVSVKDGVVTAHGEGTAVITACMSLDTGATAECTVTVTDRKLQLRGITSNAKQGTAMLTWDAKKGVQESVVVADEQIVSAVKDNEGFYWAQTAEGRMLKLDAESNELLEVIPVNPMTAGNADMTASSVYGGVFSINGAQILTPWNVSYNNAAASEAKNQLTSLTLTGATRFIGIASAGYCEYYNEDMETTNPSEQLYLLDNTGCLWSAYVLKFENEYNFFLQERGSVSGLENFQSVERDGVAYNSLVYQNGSLTLSSYNGTDTVLTLLRETENGWVAAKLGSIKNSSVALCEGSFGTEAAYTAVAHEAAEARPCLIDDRSETVAQDSETVTFAIPVQEATSNKRMTVSYDNTTLTLQSVNSTMQLVSYTNKDGLLDFGCADATALKQGNVLVTLCFTTESSNAAGSVMVDETERNAHTVQENAVAYEYGNQTCPHNYQATDTLAATCTAEGHTTYTCTLCGESYTETESASGHRYGAWTQTLLPTCTQEGTLESTCAGCGEKQTRTVEALGHDFVEQTAGVFTCTRCEDSYNVAVAPIVTSTPVLTATQSAKRYTDLTEGAWYYGAAEYVLREELMVGISSNEFGISEKTTRAMVATILYRLAGSPNVTTNAGFTDVAENRWYTDAVNFAAAGGLMSGYGDGKFGPDDLITREQLAVIFCGHARQQGADTQKQASLDGFADGGTASAWAVSAVRWAVAEGLLSGRSGGILDPQGTATRIELASILTRYLGE